MKLPEFVRDFVIQDARMRQPVEACGVVLKSSMEWRVTSVINVTPSSNTYTFDPQQQIRLWEENEIFGRSLVAIYHSHPNGRPWPSEMDMRTCAFPEVLQLVAGQERIHPGGLVWMVRGFDARSYPWQLVPVVWQMAKAGNDWFFEAFSLLNDGEE